MSQHSRPKSHMPVVAAVAVAVGLVAAAGVAFAALRASGTHNSIGREAAAASGGAPGPTTTAPPPLLVSATSPATGATAVSGTQTLTLTTTAAVDLAASEPTISPAVDGQWTSSGTALTFTPSGAYPPGTRVTVDLPATLRSTAGAELGTAQSVSFTTADASLLRLQQLLAKLGYLPLKWNPTTPLTTTAQREQAVYDPPAGTFTWTWPNVPPTLAAQWSPGAAIAMTQGAVMAFEADHNLTTDGVAGPAVWTALLAATSTSSPALNTHGYTYALADQTLPNETLTVWHNGTLVSKSGANTGIAQSPTADGTFQVYERLATQIMKGTNPDGTKYADPVAWVAYFNGGDAIHYIPRSYYGSRQSLGCVEVPYQMGQTVWPYLTLGSLVTVTG